MMMIMIKALSHKLCVFCSVPKDITDYLQNERLIDNRQGQLTEIKADHPSDPQNYSLAALGDTSQGQVPAILELLNNKVDIDVRHFEWPE